MEGEEVGFMEGFVWGRRYVRCHACLTFLFLLDLCSLLYCGIIGNGGSGWSS